MGDLNIKNVADDVIYFLEQCAAAKGCTLEEEIKSLLTEAAAKKRNKREEFIRLAQEYSEKIGPQKTDSTDLIRHLRDNL